MLNEYIQYNEIGGESMGERTGNMSTHYEFYRHKIYTTSAISTFFTFLLINFKSNGNSSLKQPSSNSPTYTN